MWRPENYVLLLRYNVSRRTTFWARRDSIEPNSYGNVAGWVAGWLSVTAGIVSKRLNLFVNFFDHLVAHHLSI